MIMQKSNHCKICDNKIIHPVKGGIACGLTKEKPAFNDQCGTIRFGENLKNAILKINLQYDYQIRQKGVAFIHLSVFTILGIITIFGGVYIRNYLLSQGWWTNIHWIVIIIGLFLLGRGIVPYISYKKNVRDLKNDLADFNSLLEMYRVDYRVKFIFGKKYHGRQDVEAEININGINRIETTQLKLDNLVKGVPTLDVFIPKMNHDF